MKTWQVTKGTPFALTSFPTVCVEISNVIKIDAQRIPRAYENPAEASYFVGALHRAWNSVVLKVRLNPIPILM